MKSSYPFLTFLCLAFISMGTGLRAQETVAFIDEVEGLTKKYDSVWDSLKETIVFTGSSSIRLWKSLEQSFPEHQIINTGFGGSQASDLLYHLDNLVLRYRPKKIFIYEGDNDIFSKKRPKEIIATTTTIIQKIKDENSTAQVVLISAKPSISRWRLRGKYKRLNKKYKKLCEEDIQLNYADVWTPMLNGKKLKKEIFISDGLHMNQKGYDIWYETVKDLVDNQIN